MSRELLRQYARPDGSILEVAEETLIRNDFKNLDPAFWNSGVGYCTVTVNMFAASESHLAISYNKDVGFYIEAHINLPYRSLSTQCPMTSSVTHEFASIWGGQDHFDVPLAFFVSSDQAAEIVWEFWQHGMLWDGVRWVDPIQHGWDLTSARIRV